MAKSEYELFLSDFLITPSNIPYFWNLMYLATGDLSRYNGPKSMDEFLDTVKTRKYYGHTDQIRDERLLNLYLNLNNPDVQNYLTWVKFLTPLVARPDQLDGILQKTHLTELDCYNTIVLMHKKFQDTKLQYDLLTRVIEKTQPMIESNRLYAEPYQNLYNVARFFRSICDWAKTSTDSTVRENLIADKLFIIRNHQTVPGKLKLSQDVMNLMMQKLENTIKTAAPQDQNASIRAVCQEAYHYVSYAGAGNQDFVNKMWDVFNWRDIVNVPAVAAKAIKR